MLTYNIVMSLIFGVLFILFGIVARKQVLRDIRTLKEKYKNQEKNEGHSRV